MRMHSPHWDEQVGACLLHGAPELPCPMCLHEKNKDIEFVVDPIERMMLEDGEATLEELLPVGFTRDNGNVIR